MQNKSIIIWNEGKVRKLELKTKESDSRKKTQAGGKRQLTEYYCPGAQVARRRDSVRPFLARLRTVGVLTGTVCYGLSL